MSVHSFPLPSAVSVDVVALIRSDIKTKAAVPRQPNIIQGLQSIISFERTTEKSQWIRGIEEFSHLWVLFLFHANGANKGRPIVQIPPGRERGTRGVFATRSPYRPNPIGLSVVRLLRITFSEDEIRLHVEGGDFLDMTPVIDLKPYIPYADCINSAVGAWATEPPTPNLTVHWKDSSLVILQEETGGDFERVFGIINDIIGHDPRPFHYRFGKKSNDRESIWKFEYGTLLVHFSVINNIAHVEAIVCTLKKT